MATIIESGNGSFIAGDPPTTLPHGHHWCTWCNGDGLDYDWDDNITTCGGCFGACTTDCTDTACTEHSTLHPYTRP